MADIGPAFNFVMSHEDSTLSGAVTPDPTTSDPSAVARFGVNSAANPKAKADGFFEMSHDAALWYAQDVFKYEYFSPIMGYQIQNQAVANKCVDIVYNVGLGNGAKIIQRACNDCLTEMHRQALLVDGKLGQRTLAAINACDPDLLLTGLRVHAKDYYVGVAAAHPEKQQYLQGWLTRASA